MMLGRAVVVAAGALLLTGAAVAQTTDAGKARAKAPAKATAIQDMDPISSEPDPLTPAEVQGPPPEAPGATAETAEPAAPSVPPDPVILEIRQRLAGSAPRGRESGADAADRAAVAAYYEADTARVQWTNEQGFTPRARLAMGEIAKADDWGLRASAFELPAINGEVTLQARADAEIKLATAMLKYARHARGGRLDPQSLSKLFDRKPQVYEPKSLMLAIAAAAEPDAYLRGLHPRHAGFRNLQKALMAARAPAPERAAAPAEAGANAAGPSAAKDGRRNKAQAASRPAPSRSDAIQRIVANMERWRWMPDDLGAFHVWNNVPDQMTTVYSSGKVVFTERIVVGKSDTPTPNFSADMQFVIFQPEWGVPSGIKSNELAPQLRRASAESSGWFGDSNYTPAAVLARHGLRVSLGNQAINPNSVNWSAVDINRFNFIQPAGPTNVLGVVKFRFPNKHDVYMHDTPQRNLFSSNMRAFSHGCMRVQNPVRFAEVLLEHDKGWASDRVRGMVPRGGEVKLTTQIPVHNVYFTATADDAGHVKTAGDIYGVDSRIASALEGRSVAVARGETAGDERGSAARAKGDRQARKRGTTTASSEFFNPFAGLFGN